MESFGLTPTAAAQDLRVVLEQLDDTAVDTPAHPPQSFLTFTHDSSGFLMRWHGEPLLRIDRHGRKVTAAAGPTQLPLDPELILKWAAPSHGEYTFQCDPHAHSMHGSFGVGGVGQGG